jgi:hypothetical protein
LTSVPIVQMADEHAWRNRITTESKKWLSINICIHNGTNNCHRYIWWIICRNFVDSVRIVYLIIFCSTLKEFNITVFYILNICLYFVNRGQPTKHHFYRRSKKIAPFYILHMLWELGYPPPILVIIKDVVTFLPTIKEY